MSKKKSKKKKIELPQFEPQPVHVGISWQALFGNTIRDLTDAQRRERWDALKQLPQSDDHRRALAWWELEEGCVDDQGRVCKHLCSPGWCDRQGLPTAYNPILKGLGMACMGLGFEVGDDVRKGEG